MPQPFYVERWTLVTDREAGDRFIRYERVIPNATKGRQEIVANTGRIELAAFATGNYPQEAKDTLNQIIKESA
jgi:hypothetical protein